MVKHTQTIRGQIADELLECVWPFCEIGAKRANMSNSFVTYIAVLNNGEIPVVTEGKLSILMNSIQKLFKTFHKKINVNKS